MSYEASNITWSIYENTDLPFEDWKEFTQVGCSNDIANIPDGEFIAKWKDETFCSETKVKVIDGHVDVQSCKQATAEILNASGMWHVFIEYVQFDKINNTIILTLGS